MKSFELEDFEDIGELINVDAGIAIWKRVELREGEDGEHYIFSGDALSDVVQVPSNKVPTKPKQNQKRGQENGPDYNFMLSLINLVKSAPSWTNFEDLMEAISPEAAVKWVQQNGFPEVEGIYGPAGVYSLSLDRFRRQVVTLYLLFYLWQALLYENEAEVDHHLMAIVEPDKKERVPGLPFKKKTMLARYFIAELTNQRLQEIHLTLTAIQSPPKIYLSTKQNTFAIAYFQLAMLITKFQGQPEKRKHLKVCPAEHGGCGNLFWGHKNRKFCPLCDRRTAYSRREKKENNGQ